MGIGNFLFRHCANFEGEYMLEHVIYPLAYATGKLSAEKAKEVGLPADVMAAVEGKAAPEEFAKALTYEALNYGQGMPWAVFSNPQVAGIGKSEDELIAEGLK